tara:strand:+ start:11992 stop:12933 length:942 start_codon:yes stop_codon:yes gene_type:complete
MKKIKLYIYPNANPHDHDSSEHCKNTVPFSKVGIEKHCVLVSPQEADYFYMGQFNNDRGDLSKFKPEHFPYFKGNESRHICDIEGEGGFEASNRSHIPDWLHNSIITTMGPLKKYSNIQYLFTRPTFSHLFMDIIRNQKEDFKFPDKKSFGIRLFMNHKVRAATVMALHKSDFEKEIHVNRKWEGLSKIGSSTQKDFIETMLNNSISLCPRGSGIDSVRFFETCYYNRLPVIITDHDYYLFGEDTYDMSFCYRIHKIDTNPKYILDELQKIYNTPIEDMKEKANAAKQYFETIVREYFEDPTLYFLKWLELKK